LKNALVFIKQVLLSLQKPPYDKTNNCKHNNDADSYAWAASAGAIAAAAVT